MICPKCGSDNCYTIDSRQKSIYRNRRHRCQDCGELFKTIETYAEMFPPIAWELNPKIREIIRLAQELNKEMKK